MGYFSRLAVDLLEANRDRELNIYEDIDEDETPKTNQELAALQQETQYSLWNEQYRKQLEQNKKAEQPKVYKKTRGSK
ncbi:MAG: hypothetical protein J6C28_02790 [Bacilli bacterium]|nr:hypothetical protein [Bacilli bacterium]